VSVRRVVDVVVAATALLALSPLLLVIALLVRRNLGSPVLFRQVRPGWHGQLFTILKFRTMRDEHGDDGELLPDDARLTRFGRVLRSSSLDELPELANVLLGDMGLIGPRPLLVQYLPLYSEEQARRHDVRPGITGLAQVSGRNGISWEEKLRLDVHYVDHRSVWLDLSILARTLRKVITRDGIAAEGYATAPYFTGSTDSGRDRP
jgi:lipopolysaccharide/colanic/teichoic acid biosynthesis glycosyltransferase